MPLRIAKRFTVFNAVTLFSVTITAAIVGVYFIFDFYLSSVSRVDGKLAAIRSRSDSRRKSLNVDHKKSESSLIVTVC